MNKRIYYVLLLITYICFLARSTDAATPRRTIVISRDVPSIESSDIDSTSERIITTVIDMDSFHYRSGYLPPTVSEYITGWEVRIGDTPVLFPFKWESKWENLNANIDPKTYETNKLSIYVKNSLDPQFDIVYNSPVITLDILDEDKQLIRRGFDLSGGHKARLINSDYRLINQRVAKQKTRTIYFRLNVDLSENPVYKNPRFNRIWVALGVEHLLSVDNRQIRTAAWQNVYGKYIRFCREFYDKHGYPDEWAEGWEKVPR